MLQKERLVLLVKGAANAALARSVQAHSSPQQMRIAYARRRSLLLPHWAKSAWYVRSSRDAGRSRLWTMQLVPRFRKKLEG
jgi:hypothetical protein